jgi:hypothetical protein
MRNRAERAWRKARHPCRVRSISRQIVRAHLHRARLGDPASFEAAQLLGAGIDNPALAALLSAAPS